jgi:hypothetical protein
MNMKDENLKMKGISDFESVTGSLSNVKFSVNVRIYT